MQLNSTAIRLPSTANGARFPLPARAERSAQEIVVKQISGAAMELFAAGNRIFRCRQPNRTAPANPAAERRSRWELAVRGVEAGEDFSAGAELGFAQTVERRLDGVEELVHVAGIGLDIEQAGDDLAQGMA